MKERRRALRAYWVAVATALLAIFVSSLTLVSWRNFPAHPIRDLQIAAIIIACAVLLLLWSRRHAPSTRLGLSAVLVILAPICAYYWFNDSVRATDGVCWVPFEGNKVGVLAIALLAPPSLVVGLLAIGAFMTSALVHFALMPVAVHQSMAAGEPWTVLAYAGIAVGIFLYRLRSTRLEDEVREAHAEGRLMQEIALISLAVRDMANTPVQTLELLKTLMQKPGADLAALEQRMQRAIDRLRELSTLLARYEDASQSGAEGALDSLALLKQKLDSGAWKSVSGPIVPPAASKQGPHGRVD